MSSEQLSAMIKLGGRNEKRASLNMAIISGDLSLGTALAARLRGLTAAWVQARLCLERRFYQKLLDWRVPIIFPYCLQKNN